MNRIYTRSGEKYKLHSIDLAADLYCLDNYVVIMERLFDEEVQKYKIELLELGEYKWKLCQHILA